MIATAKCAGLLRRPLVQRVDLGRQALELSKQVRRLHSQFAGQRFEYGYFVGVEAYRNRLFYGEAKLTERFGEVARLEIGPDGSHPAADVDPDGRGRDGAAHGDHGANRGSLAEVNIGHAGHVTKHPRKSGDISELLERLLLDVRDVGPDLDVDVLSRNFTAGHGGWSLSSKR